MTEKINLKAENVEGHIPDAACQDHMLGESMSYFSAFTKGSLKEQYLSSSLIWVVTLPKLHVFSSLGFILYLQVFISLSTGFHLA